MRNRMPIDKSEKVLQTMCIRHSPDGIQSQPGKGRGKPSAPLSGKNSKQAQSLSSPTAKIEIRDRLGNSVMRVSDHQLESLYAAGLIDYCGRRRVTHAMIRNGVSVASINATLRAGMKSSLPVAEDNRTVQRTCVASGGVYFTQIHVDAWDDRRKLDGTLGKGGYGGQNERVRDGD